MHLDFLQLASIKCYADAVARRIKIGKDIC